MLTYVIAFYTSLQFSMFPVDYGKYTIYAIVNVNVYLLPPLGRRIKAIKLNPTINSISYGFRLDTACVKIVMYSCILIFVPVPLKTFAFVVVSSIFGFKSCLILFFCNTDF